jgi:hypothetical protein
MTQNLLADPRPDRKGARLACNTIRMIGGRPFAYSAGLHTGYILSVGGAARDGSWALPFGAVAMQTGDQISLVIDTVAGVA